MHTLEETTSVARVPRARRWPIVVVCIWLGAVAGCLWLLWSYSNTPGVAAQAPPNWPVNSLIEPNQHGFTLVMFVHPKCPCTRASLTELQRIVSKHPAEISAWVVFYRPSHVSDDWEQGDLWQTAGTLPGVHRLVDSDGAETTRFGAATSGQTLVYDTHGNLRFNGGITVSRGHEGESSGQAAILQLLTNGKSSCEQSPVFGCAILPADKPK